MKKIFYAAVSIFLLTGLFSCDLEREPEGQKKQADHFVSFAETAQHRDGLYADLRGIENPSRFIWQEFQSDIFAVTTNDGNTTSRFITWSLGHLETADEIASYYLAYNSLLQRANYFLDNVDRSLEQKIYKESDLETIQLYRAEAMTLQALALSRLMERFAYKYDPAASKHPYDLGVVLVKHYDPFNSSPRSTQKDCYDYILDRLNQAIEILPAKSSEGTIRISKHYALGLRARVNLAMGNYEEAKKDAKVLVDAYPLIDAVDADDFNAKYRSDTDNSEIIFRAYASGTLGTIKETFINGAFYHSGAKLVAYSPNAVPLDWVVNLYSPEDYRKSTYLTEGFVLGSGVSQGYVIGKFLGNPVYQTNPNIPDFKVAARYFSVAEAYLILAESLAKNGDAAGAKAVLTTLSEKRGAELEDGDAMEMVMDERTREMIGEGSRLNDMVRWNLPNNHDNLVNQPTLGGVAKQDKLKQAVPAGFYAFTWEIPLRDRRLNPQMIKNWP